MFQKVSHGQSANTRTMPLKLTKKNPLTALAGGCDKQQPPIDHLLAHVQLFRQHLTRNIKNERYTTLVTLKVTRFWGSSANVPTW